MAMIVGIAALFAQYRDTRGTTMHRSLIVLAAGIQDVWSAPSHALEISVDVPTLALRAEAAIPAAGIETAVIRVSRTLVEGRNAALIVTFGAPPRARAPVIRLRLNEQQFEFRDDGRRVDE